MKWKLLGLGLGLGISLVLLYVYIIGPATRIPPNILFITIDTLRADHLGCYGYQRNITPVLDELAGEGVLFENAFAVMPTTIPSHGSMFFGTWPRIHGSTGNQYKFSSKNLPFLPRILQQAGYETSAFISIHHLTSAMADLPGFQMLNGARQYEERRCQITLNHALEWFQEQKPQRYFAWIHLWEPHQPYALHPRFMKEIYPGIDLNFKPHYSFFPEGAYTKEDLQKMVALYDNEIKFVDHNLGRFLEKLRKEKYLENTVLIITSDHGETLDEIAESHRYAFDHGEFLYDPQLHVPLMIVPPGERKGRRVSSIVTLLDLMPTILDLTGLPIPESAQGISLLPFLKGDQPKTLPELVFLHRGKYTDPSRPAFLLEEQFGVREKDFKIIYASESHKWELYNNSSEDYPVKGHDQIRAELQEKLKAWLALTEKMAKPSGEMVSPEEIEELRSLGYVQ